MKRLFSLILGILFASTSVIASGFVESKVIEKVKVHSVAVIVDYILTPDVYAREVQKLVDEGVRHPDIIKFKPGRCISYVGAGTIVPDDHVITANHLLDRIDDVLAMRILVQGNGWDKPLRAIIVYRSRNEEFHDDYAILRLAHSTGLPGIKIAEKDFKIGDKYVAVGSSGGFAYVMRFGFVIPIQKFFRRDENNELKISKWEDFPYTAIYPGAPGDSGGGVFNKKGELVTIMYCGVPSKPYVFGNPNSMLKDFLIKHEFRGFIK